MINSSSFVNYGKAFLNYQLGKTECSHYPLMIWIEPTSYCNLRCIMCPNPNLSPVQKGHMPMERFKKIVDGAQSYIRNISICHRGEPLLQKNIVEMIEYCSKAGINTSVHTNGMVLNEGLSRRLIRSGLSVISFSIDGYTKEIYESIRVGGDFDKVLNNLRVFLEIKKEMKSSAPHTSLQIIDFQHLSEKTGRDKRKGFLKMLAGLPLDRLYVKPVHNWAGNAGKTTYDHKYNKKNKWRLRCNSPWYSLVVQWDGRVYACCLDYMGRYSLGNVEEESLLDIWNGERMRRLRKEMNQGKLDECVHCTECDKLYESKFLGVSMENLLNESLFRIRWNLGIH